MRRLARHLFTLCSAVSLVVSGILLAFLISHGNPGTMDVLSTQYGGIEVNDFNFFIYRYGWHPTAYGYRPWTLKISATWVIAAFLISGWTFLVLSTRSSHTPGTCKNCGYDLIPSPKPVIAILADEQQQPTPPA
jgi:hypothetical protein